MSAIVAAPALRGEVRSRLSKEILQVVVLTKDEEPNIGRALSRLAWAESIIVLDSHSSDKTFTIVRTFPNAEIHERAFDTHATQWNYAISLAESKWVLTLDADYILTDEFVEELYEKLGENGCDAFEASFKFLVFGR